MAQQLRLWAPSISSLLSHAFVSGTFPSKIINRCNIGGDKLITSWFRHISFTASVSKLQLGGQILERPFSSSIDEDDDAFAELGGPTEVPKACKIPELMTELQKLRAPAEVPKVCRIPKLMTEKREVGAPAEVPKVRQFPKLMTEKQECSQPNSTRARKTHPTHTSSKGCSSSAGAALSHSVVAPDSSHQTKNGNGGSRAHLCNNHASPSPNCIVIWNVPSTINNSQIKEAVSAFGTVCSISMTTLPNDLSCCRVEYESMESSRKAVTAGKISIKNLHLPICALHTSGPVAVRISNIARGTPDITVHSRCLLYGPLEGLSRREENVVDALFTAKDDFELQRILEKLNSTIVHDCQWSAHLNPAYLKVRNEEDGEADRELSSDIRHRIQDIREKTSMKQIYLEDLDLLSSFIVHLESYPAAIGKLSSSS